MERVGRPVRVEAGEHARQRRARDPVEHEPEHPSPQSAIERGGVDRAIPLEHTASSIRQLEPCEEQQRQDKQKKAHADRLAALAALCDEEDEEDEEAMASPPPKAKGPVAESPLTLDQLTREAKRRGDLAPHHFNS